MSFETKTVDVASFLNQWLFPQSKLFLTLIVLIVVSKIILKRFLPEKSELGEVVYSVIWYVFKAGVYAFLFVLVFFVDYQTKQVHWWCYPNEMSLSTLFVGLLAGYEVLSNILEAVKSISSII